MTDHVIKLHRGENLRTTAVKVVKRAGFQPWPRLFQNLRSSFETDLTSQFPLHVACAWAGNTEAVALGHYLQVTDDHFEAAVGGRAAKNYAHGQRNGGGRFPQMPLPPQFRRSRGRAMSLVGFDPHERKIKFSGDMARFLRAHEKALHRALQNLRKAAPLMREADIATIRGQIDAATKRVARRERGRR